MQSDDTYKMYAYLGFVHGVTNEVTVKVKRLISLINVDIWDIGTPDIFILR